MTEKIASRYSAPLSIVENYRESGRWIIILQSTLESPSITKQIPVEVRFEYDPDPYDYDNSNPYRIFDYRELPVDYSLESSLSSQWLDMAQALEQKNLAGATTYIAQHKQKTFQRFWKTEESKFLEQAHLLRMPLALAKNETGKLTLQSADPQGKSAISKKIQVEFVREYKKGHGILSFEVLLNNEQFESELNSVWMSMWDALAKRRFWMANLYIGFSDRPSDFFYHSHTKKQYLTVGQWRKREVDWAALAKHFRVPLKLVDRCDNHISLIHLIPPESESEDPTYLEVNFTKNSFKPWKIEQYHLYSQPLPDSFAHALQDKTKGKDFDLCVQNEDLDTKDDPSYSDHIRRRLGFQ